MIVEARRYWWNGLVIASRAPLARLPLATSNSQDVELVVRCGAPERPSPPDRSATIELTGAVAHLTAPGVGSFAIDTNKGRIELTPNAPAAAGWRIADWLLQSALPIWATLQGHVCMHAVAVSHRPDHATLWVGPSGVGKSTAGAAQVRSGAGLVADDIVLLHAGSSGASVRVGTQTLRLRSDVAAHMTDLEPLALPDDVTKTHYCLPHPDPGQELAVERVAVRAALDQPWVPAQSAPADGLQILCSQVLHWELMETDARRRATERLFDLVAALSSRWDPVAMTGLGGSGREA